MQVNDLTRRQLQAGLQPEVITATPLPRKLRRSPEPLTPVPVHRSGIPIPAEIANNPLPSRPIERVLRSGRFDLVHVHAGVGSPFAAAGVRVGLRLGLPVVVTVHCLRPPFRLPAVLSPWTFPDIAARLTLNAVSEAAAMPLRERTGQPVDVLPNGLDPQDWRVDPLERDPAVVQAAATMRLSVRKRPLPLLKIVRAAQRRLESQGAAVTLRLAVYGDGKLRPRMRRFLARNAMSQTVELAGRVTRDGLKQAYRAADVFIAPAHLESFGIAALEARCAGVPVLAMRATGVTEFVRDRVEGLLADGDAGMVDALVEICLDRSLREAIADHNRRVQPATAWPAVLERLNRIYAGALRRTAVP